jgi:probable HAF family extracellular repeat protein
MEGNAVLIHQWSKRMAALGLLAMLPCSTATAQTTYNVTVIPGPNPAFTLHQATGGAINANGDILGQDVFDSSGFGAALIKAGKEVQLTYDPNQPCLPNLPCGPIIGDEALALNNNDQVVGWGFRVPVNQVDVQQRPLVWQPGQTVGQDPGFLPFCSDGVFAEGINNLGQIVGFGSNCGQPSPNIAWLFQNGNLTTLPTLGGISSAAFGINDLGQVVGNSALDANANIVHAFVWQLGTGMRDLGVLAGGQFSEAVAINKSGVAVGVSTFNGGTFATGDRHAVAFQNGRVIDLTPGLPAGFGSFATAINSSGQIVGSSLNHAFIWVNGVGTDLNTLIPPGTGITLSEADGINDKGQIAATANCGRHCSQIVVLTPK